MDPFQNGESETGSTSSRPNLFNPNPNANPEIVNASNTSIPTTTTSESTQREDPFFRVRIITIDQVFEPRSHLDRAQSAFSKEGVQLQKAPIIRIFGATPLGQRVCLHVHDVFPYCYVEYTQSLEPNHVLPYIATLGKQLNRAVLAAMRQNPDEPNTQDFVVAIHLCKATPFYGYHLGWKYFLKISFRDPKRNHLLGTVLESGNLMKGTKFQPFELHVRYLLQFFLDYNLYGCDYIDLKKCLFRDGLPDPEENPYPPSQPQDFKTKFWDSSMVPPHSEFMNESTIHKVSYCQLEMDAHASWIENRKYLPSRSHQHQEIYEKDFLKKDQKLVPSLIDLWMKFGDKSGKLDLMSLNPSSTFREQGKGQEKGKETEKSPRATNRIFKKGEQHPPGGIDDHNQKRFEERLKVDLARLERKSMDPKNLDQDYFLKRSARNPGAQKFDQFICTTFDSVPLFHERFVEQETKVEKERNLDLQTSVAQDEKPQDSSKAKPLGLEDGEAENPFSPERLEVFSQRQSAVITRNSNSQYNVSQTPSPFSNPAPTRTKAGIAPHSSPIPLRQSDGQTALETIAEAGVSVSPTFKETDFQDEAEILEFEANFNEEFFATQGFLSQVTEREAKESEDRKRLEREAKEMESENSDQDEQEVEEREQQERDDELDFKLASQVTGDGNAAEDQDIFDGDDSDQDEEESEDGDEFDLEDDMEMDLNKEALEEEMKLLEKEQQKRTVTRSLSETSFIPSPSKKRSSTFGVEESLSSVQRLKNQTRSRSSSPSTHLQRTPQTTQSQNQNHNHFLPSPFHTPSPSHRQGRKVKPIPSSVNAISSSASNSAEQEELSDATLLPSSSPPLPKPLASTLKNGNTVRKAPRPTGNRVRFSPLEKLVSSSPSSSPTKGTSSGEVMTSSEEGVKPAQPLTPHIQAPSTHGPGSSSSQFQGYSGRFHLFAKPPPTLSEISHSFYTNRMHSKLYQRPYYSDPKDIPSHTFVYADREFDLGSNTLVDLEPFDPMKELPRRSKKRRINSRGSTESVSYKFWQFSTPAPSRREIEIWRRKDKAETNEKVSRRRHLLASQVAKKSQKLSSEFKISQRGSAAPVNREKQHMTILALEVFVAKSSHLLPDPAKDPITSIHWSFQNEDEGEDPNESGNGLRSGLIILDSPNLKKLNLPNVEVIKVESEVDLFNEIIDRVRNLDPEILAGWEIHNGSWGYVFERAHQEFGFDVVAEIGRVKSGNTGKNGGKGDTWGYTKTSMFRVTGRHILNVWRLMRGELALNHYSMENIAYELLRTRIPKFSHQSLTEWFTSSSPTRVARALNYHARKVKTVLEILEKSELVFRTAEFARIYGVDFFSVLSRGSQFKVESVMFRIAKPESYVLPSPTPAQVASQNAAQCIPLVFEPESAFFTSPVLVLDFQSLYPSIMIAYNLCYSTFLGRIDRFNGEYKLGYTKHDLPDGLITKLQEDITIDPNGNMFVKPHVRVSLLSKMLGEILDTRVMIKASMKGAKGNKSFLRMQHARQLSLKLLANVTYGYTSASYSGRMPCVEIADAIVQFGRRTLEEAIETIKKNPAWGAVTVYGDTDSLFVHLEGKTKDEAFQIGNEIAEVVTSLNPHPVRLKFEKVYLPSVLLAKKRYVGWKYEAQDELTPVFDAKGIETVRRDGFPALQKVLKSALEILFSSQDISEVKAYCQRQWRKIYEGKVSIQDFIIAKEVRLGTYKENAVPPPGATVAGRICLKDHRAEPQHAERVPYLITQGDPKAKMNDRAVTPDEMIRSKKLRLDANYYIVNGIIPPLKRIFNLVGCDVDSWFNEMSRISLLSAPASEDIEDIKVKLTDHYRSNHCLICGQKCGVSICVDCRNTPTESTHAVQSDLHLADNRYSAISTICASCSLFESNESTPCISLECPILYTKQNIETQLKSLDYVFNELDKALPTLDILIEEAWR